MPNSLSTGLILFVKTPQVGAVKTRLGKTIGLPHSCELYRQFGLDLVHRLTTLQIPLLIFFAPHEGLPLVQSWLGHHQYFPQQGDDLGDRMSHAFETGFQLGFKQLLILGSDSPDLPLSFLKRGLDALNQDHSLIGPSNDGGYYTIGFSQKSWCPSVFQGIAWSTEHVYPDSLEILRSHHSPVTVLPQWYDIDTLEDLQEFYGLNHATTDLPNSIEYLKGSLSQYFEPVG